MELSNMMGTIPTIHFCPSSCPFSSLFAFHMALLYSLCYEYKPIRKWGLMLGFGLHVFSPLYPRPVASTACQLLAQWPSGWWCHHSVSALVGLPSSRRAKCPAHLHFNWFIRLLTPGYLVLHHIFTKNCFVCVTPELAACTWHFW